MVKKKRERLFSSLLPSAEKSQEARKWSNWLKRGSFSVQIQTREKVERKLRFKSTQLRGGAELCTYTVPCKDWSLNCSFGLSNKMNSVSVGSWAQCSGLFRRSSHRSARQNPHARAKWQLLVDRQTRVEMRGDETPRTATCHMVWVSISCRPLKSTQLTGCMHSTYLSCRWKQVLFFTTQTLKSIPHLAFY